MSNPEFKITEGERSRPRAFKIYIRRSVSIGSSAILFRAVEGLLTAEVAESAQTNPLELEFDIGGDHYLINFVVTAFRMRKEHPSKKLNLI